MFWTILAWIIGLYILSVFYCRMINQWYHYMDKEAGIEVKLWFIPIVSPIFFTFMVFVVLWEQNRDNKFAAWFKGADWKNKNDK